VKDRTKLWALLFNPPLPLLPAPPPRAQVRGEEGRRCGREGGKGHASLLLSTSPSLPSITVTVLSSPTPRRRRLAEERVEEFS